MQNASNPYHRDLIGTGGARALWQTYRGVPVLWEVHANDADGRGERVIVRCADHDNAAQTMLAYAKSHPRSQVRVAAVIDEAGAVAKPSVIPLTELAEAARAMDEEEEARAEDDPSEADRADFRDFCRGATFDQLAGIIRKERAAGREVYAMIAENERTGRMMRAI